MKKAILAGFLSLISLRAFAVETITPMGIVEKVAYQLSGLVKRNLIDASYLTDVVAVTVEKNAEGYSAVLMAPSAEAQVVNTFTVLFDNNGKSTGFSSQFVSKYPQGPIFTKANASVLLDLGAEAIVDNLTESPEIVTVAENTHTVRLQHKDGGVLLVAELLDGSHYAIKMDLDGNVLSKGFDSSL